MWILTAALLFCVTNSLLFGIMVFQSPATPSCYQGIVSEEEMDLHLHAFLKLRTYILHFTLLEDERILAE